MEQGAQVCGSRGGERFPVQPGTARSKDGEERGVRERRYCVCVPWGRR